MNKIFEVLKRNINSISIVNENCLNFDDDQIYQVVVSSSVNRYDLQIIKENISYFGIILYLSQGPTGFSEKYLENLEISLNNLDEEITTKKQALYISFLMEQDSYISQAFPFMKVRNLNNISREQTSYIIHLLEKSMDRKKIIISNKIKIIE